MAGKLKGLTVEIDGDVTGLSKAIVSVNSDAKKLQTELRGITRLLKYDPKNVARRSTSRRRSSRCCAGQKRNTTL